MSKGHREREGIRGGSGVGGEGCKAGEGEGDSRIHKWKHERPLYLELLKIAQQMVAGASWPKASTRPVESIGTEP